jgi:hypothetical protein
VVAGSGGEVAPLPWRRALLAWMLIILLETLHGMLREIFMAPVMGDLGARQIGVLIGSLIVLAVALLTVRWIGVVSRRGLLWVGASWVALTLAFEILLARVLGMDWERFLTDYNPARGGFMIAGLAVMFIAPWVASNLRRSSAGRTA